MIQGVEIIPLKRIPDERGMIMHFLRADSPHFEQFGEVYFATAFPGVIKGWHVHTIQTQNYCVIQGMIKLVLFDDRKDSATYNELQELFIGENNYCLVKIPTGVINGWKCIGDKTALLANCATHMHTEGEMLRYEPFGDKVPYNWDVVMK